MRSPSVRIEIRASESPLTPAALLRHPSSGPLSQRAPVQAVQACSPLAARLGPYRLGPSLDRRRLAALVSPKPPSYLSSLFAPLLLPFAHLDAARLF